MKPAILKILSETHVEIVRGFDSSVEYVWKTFTDTSLVLQWMIGPPG
jgi:uncharacterized protein YndB with AHSA1/START domain